MATGKYASGGLGAGTLSDTLVSGPIETENRDVIGADGTSAEMFTAYVGRAAFDNHSEFVALYGGDRNVVEMPRPRIPSARLGPQAIKARLRAERAA